MKSDFEQRRDARLDRARDLSEKRQAESDAAFRRARTYTAGIPMGQPILVGHHSEKRHRRAVEKAHDAMHRGVELEKTAEHHARRAEAIASNTAIFSDDPAAEEKLEAKIEKLDRRQKLMREANKCVRRQDVPGLLALGFSEAAAAKLLEPDFCGRIGFADYQLSNNNANLRRLKERLAALSSRNADATTEREIGEIRIVDNVEENRLQMFFPGKPADEVRAQLKSHGFRWSPSEGAWQRHRGSNAAYYADQIANALLPHEPTPPTL